MKPLVTGLRCEPSIDEMRPCSTPTDKLQASGQSSGHAVSTRCSVLNDSCMFEVYCMLHFGRGAHRDPRRRFWRTVRRQNTTQCEGPGDAARSAQSPRLPTAAVSGCDRDALARRYCVADPL